MRKQLPNLENGMAVAFKGELHLEDDAIIYDLADGKSQSRKRRSRKPKAEQEILAEKVERVGNSLLVD